MGNGVTVGEKFTSGERLTTDMSNGTVVQTLYETIAKTFDVNIATLIDDTRFEDLKEFDEHIMEELRTNFEDALKASRGSTTPELIASDFNDAETIGELIEVIRHSQIF